MSISSAWARRSPHVLYSECSPRKNRINKKRNWEKTNRTFLNLKMKMKSNFVQPVCEFLDCVELRRVFEESVVLCLWLIQRVALLYFLRSKYWWYPYFNRIPHEYITHSCITKHLHRQCATKCIPLTTSRRILFCNCCASSLIRARSVLTWKMLKKFSMLV